MTYHLRTSTVLLITLSLACSISQAQLPVLRATSTTLDVRQGDEFAPNGWTIVPDARPDVMDVDVKGRAVPVTFASAVDSFSTLVNSGDTIDLVVLSTGMDSAFTRIIGHAWKEPVRFSDAYKKEHRGKWSFEIPEVQELVHIIMAIAPTGIADSNMVEHETAYYTEVMNHFTPFADAPAVKEVDKLLRQGRYAHVKMDACGFNFVNDRIVKDDTYDRLNWGRANLVEPMIGDLEEFAARSGFRTFYGAHRTEYDSIRSATEHYMPIKAQWDWCEQHFPARYDNYRITFSPLVNGWHCTNRFETPDFKQTVMFVCPAWRSPGRSEGATEGLNTRIVLTEIDHNYVNPVSDVHAKQINSAMDKRSLWANEGDAPNYGSNYAVFNEYMTWAVFTLYAKERFSAEDFQAINERTVRQMEKSRGFIRFSAFNQKMIELYEASTTKQIPDLYPAILAWCAEQR